jgi:hypothetical protein
MESGNEGAGVCRYVNKRIAKGVQIMEKHATCYNDNAEELFGEDFYCEEDEILGEMDSI